jgi:hypothetical protein
MKPSVTSLVVVLLLVCMLAGCAPGPNQSKGMAGEHGLAGFWLGLWQGFIAPFVFVASLLKTNLFGLACFFGGGGNRAARRK